MRAMISITEDIKVTMNLKVNQLTLSNEELVDLLKRALGYSLDVKEHIGLHEDTYTYTEIWR